MTLSYGSWDTHGQNFTTMRRQLPVIDRGIANLVQDLCDRGMDKDVAVVMWGEFGRTPRINGGAGRDHWSPVIRPGGRRRSEDGPGGGRLQRSRRVSQGPPRDGAAGAQHPLPAVGIDPAMTFPNGGGRPMYVLDDREPISELL